MPPASLIGWQRSWRASTDEARPLDAFPVSDYLAATPHLSTIQHGAYLFLIMHYWQQGGLPDDDEQLARIACMSIAEWRKHRPYPRRSSTTAGDTSGSTTR